LVLCCLLLLGSFAESLAGSFAESLAGSFAESLAESFAENLSIELRWIALALWL